MKKKLPLISIQILNWNRAEETVRAIYSVQAQTYPNIEIVVVDNNSTDHSVKLIKEIFPSVKIIELDKNYGCPGGRNRGVYHCAGECIYFCDNDGVLHKDAVLNAYKCMQKDDDIVIVTGLVKDFTLEGEIDTQYQLPSPKFKTAQIFQGGVTLHKKYIYSEISMYPDDYMYGGEETYLSLRVLDTGFKIVKCEQSILWHKRSSLARDLKKEALQAWSNTLSTAYQLYPLEYFILYFVYYWIVYPYYAIKKGFFIDFYKTSGKTLRRLSNYKREPIKRSTYKKFNQSKRKLKISLNNNN